MKSVKFMIFVEGFLWGAGFVAAYAFLAPFYQALKDIFYVFFQMQVG